MNGTDKLRLTVQGTIAVVVLGGATFLGYVGAISSEAIVALYSAALGAVGAGAVGGIRQNGNSGVQSLSPDAGELAQWVREKKAAESAQK